MARPALSATRGLDILDFLGSFPGRGFTMSEIMRAVGINVASCHAILSALTERGYIVRDGQQKTFRLGPVPVALGEVALQAQPMLGRAKEIAQELARELDVPVLLTAAVGDDMLGLATACDLTGHGPSLAIGERRPMVPPLGGPFVAWGDEATIAGWLERGGHAGDSTFAAEQRRALGLIRQSGFQVSLRSPSNPRLSPEGASETTDYKNRMIQLVNRLVPAPLAETIEPDQTYDVNLIAAPVFDRSGACLYNLCLGDFAGQLSGQTIISHAERLVTACLSIMQAQRG